MAKRRSKGLESSAVKAQRAPAIVKGDDAQTALFRQLELFPTPPWGTRAGVELIRMLDQKRRLSIWDPCAGQGHMARVLCETKSFDVIASDIHDYGCGYDRWDFLSEPKGAESKHCDWLICNPPFTLGARFIKQGLRQARRGVAALLRLQFLESAARYSLFHGEQACTLVAPFAERLPMVLGAWDPEARSASAYAWFLWRHGADPLPLHIIPPGTQRRLTRKDDAAKFGRLKPAPLLETIA